MRRDRPDEHTCSGAAIQNPDHVFHASVSAQYNQPTLACRETFWQGVTEGQSVPSLTRVPPPASRALP